MGFFIVSNLIAMAWHVDSGDNSAMTGLLLNSLMLAQSTQPAAQGAAGSQSEWMVYAIIAFGMAFALIVLEAFVPSGGVLGILAGVAAIVGIVLFFRFDTTWGMVSMGVTLAAVPFIIAGLIWVWPNTPIGRALTLDENQESLVERDKQESGTQPDAIAVGMEGEALTELRPVGTCRLNGKRTDCIAQSGLIKKGTKVRVVLVEGMSVKVRAIEGQGV